MSIPKIIHQIWLQGTSYISDKSKERIDKIKNIHEISNGDYKGEYKAVEVIVYGYIGYGMKFKFYSYYKH